MSIRRTRYGWQARVSPFPNVTLPTREAAELVEVDMKKRKLMGGLYQEPAKTLGRELAEYKQRKISRGGRKGKLRPATVLFYDQCERPWEPLADVPIPSLRRSMVEDRAAKRARTAPVAARNELQFIKAALREAESRGQQVDPGIFLIAPISHQAAEGHALELAQLDAISAWMPERVKRIVPFVGRVGLRFSEAVNLTDKMLDLGNAQLKIPTVLNKSRRPKPIPLSKHEVVLLAEQLMIRTPGTSLVFPTANGRVYSKSGFRSVWLPALEKEGLTGTHFHWLRHTAISHMAQAGMPVEAIALRVGHSDGGALILKTYRHLFDTEIRSAVSLLDEYEVVVERSRKAVSL